MTVGAELTVDEILPIGQDTPIPFALFLTEAAKPIREEQQPEDVLPVQRLSLLRSLLSHTLSLHLLVSLHDRELLLALNHHLLLLLLRLRLLRLAWLALLSLLALLRLLGLRLLGRLLALRWLRGRILLLAGLLGSALCSRL